jgi:anti-anti-sigma factor
VVAAGQPGYAQVMPDSSSFLDGQHTGIGIRELPGGVVISLRGDHDLSTKPQLVAALTRLRREAWTVIVIDLRQCTFVDSTIIGAILAARRQDSSQPTVSVVLPDDRSYVYRALSVIGLTTLVPAHASIEAALGATAAEEHVPR